MGLLASLASLGTAAEKPRIVAAHLGLGDQYKLGCWAPLRVLVEGGNAPLVGQVLAVTPDSDGVNVGTSAPGGRPIALEPGRVAEERLYVRVGQMNAPIDIKLNQSDGRQAQRLFSVGDGTQEEVELGQELPLPTATPGWLALQLGADCGVEAAVATTNSGEYRVSGAVVTDANALPRDAIGYDSFDVVLLAAGSRAGGETGGWLGAVSPEDPRIAALTAWVEGGGRLVLSCGAGGATLLAPGGALAHLAPGEFVGPGSLSIATPLEAYAESEAGPIDLQGNTLPISELEGAAGVVEAFAGRSADETPLVVRTPYGFGEVTFVACDLDHPVLAGWQGRRALLKNLLRPPEEEDPSASTYPTNDWGQGGLVNQLVEQLDAAFTGVKTAPFLLIVGLVLLYLLLIGPGDYFFVKNVLKRVEASWVTFPLIVIATSAAAYAGAYWLKGGKLRVNQVEIIDIDSTTGQTRGLLLTHLFSPEAVRYDLSLSTRSLLGEELPVDSSWSGWLGKTGGGLGGMDASGSATAIKLSPNYFLDPTPLPGDGEPSVNALPVQVWSTKSLVSRYRGATQRVVEATLAEDGVGGIEGQVTNDTGAKLTDCRLLFGAWSWSLGTLGDGESASVDPSISPIRIKKLLGEKTETFDAFADRFTFGSLASGTRGPASRYLHDLDLVHHLEAGKALLVARVEKGPVSELTRNGEPLVDDSVQDEEGPSRKSWVYARFILPVQEE